MFNLNSGLFNLRSTTIFSRSKSFIFRWTKRYRPQWAENIPRLTSVTSLSSPVGTTCGEGHAEYLELYVVPRYD